MLLDKRCRRRRKKNARGTVTEDGGKYRAHIQFRNVSGRKENIYGPWRAEGKSAKEDLAAIQAYDALFAGDREGGRCAMRAEARRIQERVAFEHEIPWRYSRRKPMSAAMTTQKKM